MNHPLSFFQTDLSLTVSSLCSHLRKKSYATKKDESEAMVLLVRAQMLVNELSQYIHYHKSLVAALEKHQAGKPFDDLADDEEPETIYEYCLHYFEGADCPLGTATDDLRNWVETYSERQQLMTQAFDRLFATKPLKIITRDDQGASQIREATEADKFELTSRTLLQSIEISNTLQDYIERMLMIHGMLLMEAPVDEVLRAINSTNS